MNIDFTSFAENLNNMANDIEKLKNQQPIEQQIETIEQEPVWHLVCLNGPADSREQGLSTCAYLYKDKEAIIFDSGSQGSAKVLIDSLLENGIEKILAIILSHWHIDHYKGLYGDLLNAPLDFQGCQIYLPHKKGKNESNFFSRFGEWGTNTQNMINNFKSRVNSMAKNIAIYEDIDEGSSVYFVNNEVKLTFYNLNPDYYPEYDAYRLDEDGNSISLPQYNNFSMIVMADCNNHKIFFPGDIFTTAQNHYYDLVGQADIYLVEHHGLNYTTNTNYLNNLRAKINIITNYGKDHRKKIWQSFIGEKHPTVKRCAENGILYDCAHGPVIVDIYKDNLISQQIKEDYYQYLAIGPYLYTSNVKEATKAQLNGSNFASGQKCELSFRNGILNISLCITASSSTGTTILNSNQGTKVYGPKGYYTYFNLVSASGKVCPAYLCFYSSKESDKVAPMGIWFQPGTRPVNEVLYGTVTCVLPPDSFYIDV